ncbi:hypothetical protein OHA71_35190 [Streptomyces sp. NBC_00444]|uniref:hypothetical protein n=1 Tax=Streptomyces sp. NBC_00444 TaxID=2975744 RepID=UPI002E1F9B8B
MGRSLAVATTHASGGRVLVVVIAVTTVAVTTVAVLVITTVAVLVIASGVVHCLAIITAGVTLTGV